MTKSNTRDQDAIYAFIHEAGKEIRGKKLKELREYLLLTSNLDWVENPDDLTPQDKEAIADCEIVLPVAVDALEHAIEQVREDTVKNGLIFAIMDLVNAFRIAAKYAKPSNLAKRQFRSPQRTGGKGRGKQKRSEAKKLWQDAALKQARDLRNRDPGFTNNDIANEIYQSWNETLVKPHVQQEWLYRVICKWVNKGSLSPQPHKKP